MREKKIFCERENIRLKRKAKQCLELCSERTWCRLTLCGESSVHGGLRCEAAVVGNITQTAIGMLTNEADCIAHSMLVDHIVERTVAATLDDLGDVFRIGTETGYEQVDGDVLLREDVVLDEHTVETLTQLIVAFVGKSR